LGFIIGLDALTGRGPYAVRIGLEKKIANTAMCSRFNNFTRRVGWPIPDEWLACDAMGLRATVMVVEDDHDIRDSLAVALTDAGYDVIDAQNGKVALDRLASARPSVILLDLMMPVLNGLEFLVEFRKNPSWARIPVIVASANRGYDASDLGTFAVLRKPLDLDDLLDSVSSALSPQRA
jgi:CheY-like chemotaxis protein